MAARLGPRKNSGRPRGRPSRARRRQRRRLSLGDAASRWPRRSARLTCRWWWQLGPSVPAASTNYTIVANGPSTLLRWTYHAQSKKHAMAGRDTMSQVTVEHVLELIEQMAEEDRLALEKRLSE